ncbi:MAG TPA: hypothetical protein GYA10_05605 [Alphaproteobacteria bacterium]|nr:hypothetical protein [Alphaproteobacteria bacterium]
MLAIAWGGLAAIAAVAWVFALVSAIRVVSAARPGQGARAFMALGWWQFDKVRSLTTPASQVHVRNYVRAFIAFMAAVLLIAATSALVSATAPTGANAG